MIFLKKILIFFIFISQLSLLNSLELEENKDLVPKLYTHASVNDKLKFVWFRVPKAASCTIRGILAKNRIGHRFDKDNFNYNQEQYKDYFKFTYVRNPWSRVVSCYVQKVKKHHMKHSFGECFNKGFDYFVDFIDRQDLRTADKHIRLQTALVPVKDMDFVGRLENFDEDLLYVGKKLGIEIKKIPKKNQTKHLHYSQYYTKRTREIIRRKYKADIKAFGYKFEKVVPKESQSPPEN